MDMAKGRSSRDTAQGKDGLTFEVDVEAANRQLEAYRMTSKEARSAIQRGLRAAAGVISKQAKQNLSGVRGKHGTAGARRLKEYIRVGTYKDLSGAFVSITGKASKGDRTYNRGFILKFFENGTKERYSKKQYIYVPGSRINKRFYDKPRYRGKIQASHFFSRAVTAKGGEAQATLQRFIELYIHLIASKRK